MRGHLQYSGVAGFLLIDNMCPHGSCMQAIFQALERARHQDWFQDCGTEVFLYRGAWQVPCPPLQFFFGSLFGPLCARVCSKSSAPRPPSAMAGEAP